MMTEGNLYFAMTLIIVMQQTANGLGLKLWVLRLGNGQRVI